MTTPTPTLTPPGSAPSRGDPANFRTRADSLLGWLATMVSELTTMIAWIATQASTIAAGVSAAASSETNASASAQASAASASAAASVSGAAPWVNGGTYAQNACVVSLVTFQTYRKKTASSVTTIEPSIDSVNWAVLGSSPSVAAIELTYSQYGAV